MIKAFSEYERNIIRKRQAEGIERARKNGRYKNNGGNKPKETIEQISINLMYRCA